MAHHIYTTDAFVIESNPSGEANKLYLIFTKDFGMLRASAQGVRLLKSKLRFSLQDFSLTSISLVRGKEVWRITNARLIENLGGGVLIAHIFSLIKRLVTGEEKNEELFVFLQKAFAFMHEYIVEKENSKSFEAIVVLNILSLLGYLRNDPVLQPFITEKMTLENIEKMHDVRKHAYQEINSALRETQL